MNQRSKNIRLFAVLGILTVITALVITLGGGANNTDFNRDAFTLDRNAVLTDVVLDGSGLSNSFSFQQNRWIVNGKYPMDESMMNVFFTIVSSMQILRPVAESQRDSLAAYIKAEGLNVQIKNNADLLQNYWIGGNEERGISWCMGADEIPYVVYLPGYQSYLAGIFDAAENDWRDRRVFSGTWTNTANVSVNFQNSEPLEMTSSGVIFQIKEYETDTTLLMNYVEQVLFLQAEEYLEPSEKLENLRGETPWGTINIEMVGARSEKLALYNTPDKRRVYGILNDMEFVAIDINRVQGLVKKKADLNK